MVDLSSFCLPPAQKVCGLKGKVPLTKKVQFLDQKQHLRLCLCIGYLTLLLWFVNIVFHGRCILLSEDRVASKALGWEEVKLEKSSEFGNKDGDLGVQNHE